MGGSVYIKQVKVRVVSKHMRPYKYGRKLDGIEILELACGHDQPTTPQAEFRRKGNKVKCVRCTHSYIESGLVVSRRKTVKAEGGIAHRIERRRTGEVVGTFVENPVHAICGIANTGVLRPYDTPSEIMGKIGRKLYGDLYNSKDYQDPYHPIREYAGGKARGEKWPKAAGASGVRPHENNPTRPG